MTDKKVISSSSEIIGLLPAAGTATRISPLPCSKELYPVGFHSIGKDQNLRPKVVSHYLLEKYRLAGATKTYIILRSGKWDIPTYFGDGKSIGMDLAYLIMNLPYGPPYSLDQAFSFVQHARIVLGFPDILFQPSDVFQQLIDQQIATNADIVLGLFFAENPQKVDMVELDEKNRVCRIVIKPQATTLKYTWIMATWTPVFTHFMHLYLQGLQQHHVSSYEKELHLGDVIQAAIDQKLVVEKVIFPEGKFLDIGTADDLMRAVQGGFPSSAF